MNLIPKFADLKNIAGGRRLTREEAIFRGVALAAVLMLLLILWDGYIFYSSLVVEQPRVRPDPLPAVSFSEKDVDEVIKLLDERRQKFDNLLGVTR